MRYELIPILFILAILLLAGITLIIDAVRRAIQDERRTRS
jgi:hypothetical protein